MNEMILSSKEIVQRAISEYKPYAIVLMLSGGDDSMTALAVSKHLDVPITHIMHGVTGTGIHETTDFVHSVVSKEKPVYIEANAGDAYVNYIMRKGFFGVGNDAHAFAYHILKWTHFRREVSKNIRHKKRNRNILFINGARRRESENRMKTMVNPIRVDGSNIWVNIINEWDKPQCISFLDGEGIKRNPVSKELCRSGECMCGTMQSKNERMEASILFPKWGRWVDALDKEVKNKFGWGWGEKMPKRKNPNQLELFQPMCTGCKVSFEDNKHLF
jgi:3'-phosphoadenosine 5'-phosphosulfate sulfotransferase (PAPS reductase)/FAD synthetase